MILGYKDLSQRWGITESTLRKRLERGQLPEPDARVGKSPGWLIDTIQKWEDNRGHTGRDPTTS